MQRSWRASVGNGWAAWLALGPWLGACAVFDPDATQQGCDAYALGTCSALARCNAAWIAPYGSFEGCQDRLSRSCADNLRQPDVVGSGAGAGVCGELMAAIDCNDLFNQELPFGCAAPSGRRSVGISCAVGAQCASARCAKRAAGARQGTCQERLGEGARCLAPEDCASGLVCSLDGVCGSLAALGQPCSEQVRCRAPSWCYDGHCIAELPKRDPEAECARFGSVLCAQLDRCSQRLIETAYGDLQTCELRTAGSCLSSFSVMDAVAGAQGLGDCTSALSEAPCSAVLENALPPACRYAPGGRPDAHSCKVDAQCASTRCARDATGLGCGVCAPLASGDEACEVGSDCGPGLVCTSEKKCRSPGGAGTACDAGQPCLAPLMCLNGTCGVALGAADACDPASDRCNVYAGLLCQPRSRTCEPWTSAQAGQPCGYDLVRGWTGCVAGSACVQGATGMRCEAPVADGARCEPGAARSCLAPARCLDGICQLPSQQVCP